MLNNKNVKELKEMAKELKVKNWWTLKKADLITAIEAAQIEETTIEVEETEDVVPESIQNEFEGAEEVTNDEVIEEKEEAAQNEPETTEEEPTAEEEPKKQRGKDLIEWNGKTQNLSQWAKELGMPGQTLFARLYISHWTVEKAFTTPVKKRNKKTEEEA